MFVHTRIDYVATIKREWEADKKFRSCSSMALLGQSGRVKTQGKRSTHPLLLPHAHGRFPFTCPPRVPTVEWLQSPRFPSVCSFQEEQEEEIRTTFLQDVSPAGRTGSPLQCALVVW